MIDYFEIRRVCLCGCGQTPMINKDGSYCDYFKGHYLIKRPEYNFKTDKNTGCWNYCSSKDSHGYGQFKVNYKNLRAHRYMYEKYNGEIPKNFDVDHLCKNPGCINPEHLEAVTHGDNIRRGSNAKLSAEDVIKIRSLDGIESRRSIRNRYKISGTQLCNIMNHKKWKGVISYGKG